MYGDYCIVNNQNGPKRILNQKFNWREKQEDGISPIFNKYFYTYPVYFFSKLYGYKN